MKLLLLNEVFKRRELSKELRLDEVFAPLNENTSIK